MSVPNPPVKVLFQCLAWANFASGVVPAQVASALGIDMVAVRDVIGRHAPRSQPLDGQAERELGRGLAAVRNLAAGFGVPWSLITPHFGVLRPSRLPPHALDGEALEPTARPGDAVEDSFGSLVSQTMMTPVQIRQMREARGLSRSAAAERATELAPSQPISERAVETLETAGRIPAAANALARLDMVYGTDGRLGIERVFDSGVHPARAGEKHLLHFPDFWSGHVWLQPRGPQANAVGVIELVWGPWQRRQRVRSGNVITTRKASTGTSPLHVRLPPGWHLTAGTGAVPTALDVNQGWRPVNAIAALSLLRDNISAVRKATHGDAHHRA